MRRFPSFWILALALVSWGCEGVMEVDDPDVPGDDPGDDDTTGDDNADDDDSGDDDSGDDDDSSDDDTTEDPIVPPAFQSYSGGTCPPIAGGPTSDEGLNEGFMTAGEERAFRLIAPEAYDGSEPWPLVFAWHHLNADGDEFVGKSEMEMATEELHFLGVVFEEKPDAYWFNWPFIEVWGAEEELVFFDDLLACIGAQYNVDPYQVHGIGVSAGGLWLTYLSTTPRVQHLASVMTLSGGLGSIPWVWEMQYAPQPHKFPAFTLDGGPEDTFVIDFQEATWRYRDELLADDHFVIYCEHTAGHDMPPMEPPQEGQTTFWSLWQFMFDHPYGLAPGESPYLATGLPEHYPEWCEIAS